MEEEKKTDSLKAIAKEVVGWEDNKLFLTIKSLTKRPAWTIAEYCRGDNHKLLSPVVYYLGIESLKSYLFSVTGLSDYFLRTKVEEMRVKLLSMSFADQADKLPTNLEGDNPLNSFFAFFISEIGHKIITLPLLLFLTWIFYKRYNNSLKENSWFALYSAGHASLLSLPVILLVWYVTKEITLIATLGNTIVISYWVWASMQFYKIKIGKAILLRVLLFVMMAVILSITSIIIVFTL